MTTYEGTVTAGAAIQYAHQMTEPEARAWYAERRAGAVSAGYTLHPEQTFDDCWYVQGYRSVPVKVGRRVKTERSGVTIMVRIVGQ